MQINGIGHVHGPQQINAPHRTSAPQPSTSAATNTAAVDQLDISPQADLVSRVRDIPDIRQDRVAEIRAQIQNGTYETDDKLDAALSNLLDELV